MLRLRYFGYAAFDLLLQNSSITKRCFVILSKAKNLNHWVRMTGTLVNLFFSFGSMQYQCCCAECDYCTVFN